MLGNPFPLTAFYLSTWWLLEAQNNENKYDVTDVFIQYCFFTDVQERSVQYGRTRANQPWPKAVYELHSPAAVPGQTAIP